jgi:gamma-glutamylcyclotransferase (GGCT)/AIG2-like uncharacterized protein YtfP
MAEYLFTYGTLQPGHAPAAIASAAARLRHIGEGHVRGTLYDLGRYPGAILNANPADTNARNANSRAANSARKIHGAVYKLPDDYALLRRLDAYEEYIPNAPALSLYLRVLHPVELAVGQFLACWMYVYNRDVRSARVVESGRWPPEK